MKKYIVLSTLIHSALLLPLLWVGNSPLVPNAATTTLRFEILAFQEGDKLLPLSQKQKVLSTKPEPPLAKRKPLKRTKAMKSRVSQRLENQEELSSDSEGSGPSSPKNSNESESADTRESALKASQQKLDYAQQLKLYIEQNKFYPRSARKLKQTGLVRLQVEIDKNGNFRNIQIGFFLQYFIRSFFLLFLS